MITHKSDDVLYYFDPHKNSFSEIRARENVYIPSSLLPSSIFLPTYYIHVYVHTYIFKFLNQRIIFKLYDKIYTI